MIQYRNERNELVTIRETATGWTAWNNEWAVDMGAAETELGARILAEGHAEHLSND